MLFLLISLNAAECKRDYITWDDLKVDVHKPSSSGAEYLNKQLSAASSRSSNSSSRNEDVIVIVVDPNGGGDCLSVQAAVDLVPHNNTRRVKILILPGIYRFSSSTAACLSRNCF